jgi:hypothetical protein
VSNDEQIYLMENLAGIFIRCFLLIYALLLLWFISYLVGEDWGYNLTTQWFQVSKHEYDLLSYCGIAFVKICALIFFLCPYIAIKLVLRRQKIKNNN